MTKASLFCSIAILAVTLGGAGAGAQPRGGTAEYWMSAETSSGFAAMTGGNPADRGAAMRNMMSGNTPAYVRNLRLELGSPRLPNGAPQAEHLPPPGLQAGPSLPLVTPESRVPEPNPRPTGLGNGDGGANARIVYYWGCGERARPGQPFQIDLSSLREGRMPAGMNNVSFRPMTPPSAATSATYGEWPNQRSRTVIPAGGSLLGDHVIRGNYSPEIRLSLGHGQDFLAPLVLTSNTPAASGAVPVAWQAVPNARAYFLMASGARSDGTIVIWTSSEIQFSQMGLFDYLSQEEIARLLQQRVLLQPTVTQCTVPAEVASQVQAASLMMTAFGPEANFAQPRPAGAARGWAPEWTVKLRTRSAYAGMLGQDVEAMMRGNARSESGESGRQAPPSRRRPSLGDRVRQGILGF